MKKPRKTMESPSIRSYEDRVRKNLLNNYIGLLALFIIGAVAPLSAGTPAFLIYHDGIDLSAESRQLELSGARVRQNVPPNILVVELPDSIRPNKVAGVKSAYTSVITLSTLEPYGPVAVAAGMQWNRGALKSARASGQGLGATRVLVAQRSLPAAPPPALELLGSAGIRVNWTAIDGAIYYELEAALDASFDQRFLSSRTNRPTADIALPEGTGNKTIYVRVRGVDIVDGEDGSKEDVFGAWSRSDPLSVTATPPDNSIASPVLTSPNPDHVSEGFTLILEWTGPGLMTRVQISRNANFQTTVYDAVASEGEYVVPSAGLRVGDTLYWRARTWGTQKSEWTQGRKLKIAAPRNEHVDMFVNPESPQ